MSNRLWARLRSGKDSHITLVALACAFVGCSQPFFDVPMRVIRAAFAAPLPRFILVNAIADIVATNALHLGVGVCEISCGNKRTVPKCRAARGVPCC
jgi:hypothetical protein